MKNLLRKEKLVFSRKTERRPRKKMSAGRKIPNFRQLSFTCESPSPHHKRRSLKKQFSEDIPDFKDSWFDQGPEIHKYKKFERNASDRPPPVKIAWGEKAEVGLNEEVIIKKCKEIKRATSGKLTRHPSLEKDSILNSKQDLTERLRNNKPLNDKENEKADVKPNLQIFLAHSTQDSDVLDSQIIDLTEKPQPKYLQPLVTNLDQTKAFQIKKSSSKKPIDSPKAPDVYQNRSNFSRSNTIVVVPLVEAKPAKEDQLKTDDSNGINVIIRPMTAQSRREKFQKRANSAFHSTSKDQPATIVHFRPPLVRSSSAPSTKPEKSKFLASKRKLRGSKKFHGSPKGEDRSPKNIEAQEWKNAANTGADIVTMVSLISPSGSENEAESEDEVVKERPKSVLKRESSVVDKSPAIAKEEGGVKEVTKNVSLRKTVKSVSFQQSSIHAVRSFSASFPARRGSMATTLTLGNTSKPNPPKVHEKRAPNPNSPHANERVPKRRLVRSNTEETKPSSTWQKAVARTKEAEEINSAFAIDIQTKSNNEANDKVSESSMKLNLDENVILLTSDDKKDNNTLNEEENNQKNDPTCDTPKEKQCWAMYCKMTEKGINVTYDTILRGMLTPTEYRIRRKTSIADEMQMLVHTPSEETKLAVSEGLIKDQRNPE